MTIRQEDQLNDARDETLFKFGGKRVLVELQVQGFSELMTVVGVKAQSKDVVIRRVVGASRLPRREGQAAARGYDPWRAATG